MHLRTSSTGMAFCSLQWPVHPITVSLRLQHSLRGKRGGDCPREHQWPVDAKGLCPLLPSAPPGALLTAASLPHLITREGAGSF